jgi:4-amino-4-deoxy-L-arabinose transferase-like glycosyltransferase
MRVEPIAHNPTGQSVSYAGAEGSASTFIVKIVALIVVAGAVYLIGNGRTQLFDRDEPRYAQCSRQMLQSGDWVVPRLYDKIRAAKPPGIYWCQAMAMKCLGDNAFAARLPSAVAMVLTLALLAVGVWREAGSRHAVWTCFIFATSLLTIYAAKVSMTDSVLLLWTVVPLGSIYLLWRGRGGWSAVATLSVAIGFAGLVKGPFVLGVLGGTLAMLLLLGIVTPPHPNRFLEGRRTRARQAILAGVRILIALAIVAAIVGPWLWLVQHREPNFLRASTVDAMQHLEHGSEGHWGPPGYHLLLIWATFLPWSILLPLAMVVGFRNRGEPLTRFALAASLGPWIFVELLGTKLPHYILPAFPALAVLTADAVIRCLRGELADLQSVGFKVAVIVVAVAFVGIATAPWWWLAIRFHDFPWMALLSLAATGLVVAFVLGLLVRNNRIQATLISMGLGSLALAAVLFGVYFPRARPLLISTQVAEILREQGAVHRGDVQMLDFKEPSLGFYQGGTIREAELGIPAIQSTPPAPRYLVMTRSLWNQLSPSQRSTLEIVGHPVSGLNYSDSLRPVEVLVVKNNAPDLVRSQSD